VKDGQDLMANDELAARLGVAMERWSLDAALPVAETATSWVLRATSKTGVHALKLLKPYGFDEISGARLMQWWGGEGAARIDAIDGHDVLMEWLDGGTLGEIVRADNASDWHAMDVLCGVLTDLHRPRLDALPTLWPLDGWMKPLRESDLAFMPVEVRPLWARVQGILARLLETTTERLPLHGDLHHDNVIGADGRWRVIDPKGLFGDPVFDGANLFRNPYPADALVFQPTRIDALADRLSQRMGWPRRRILEWACVLNGISAVWTPAGSNFDWEMRMMPVLLAALDRSQ
jgi:streptomycin 6-kinase